MAVRLGRTGLLAVLGLVAACGAREPDLMRLTSPDAGPDEFAVLPTKPLELPDDLAALPAPTPGGANRTDPTPLADAARALGGTGVATGGRDGALVGYAGRYGVREGIRAELAAEDRDYRRRNAPLLLPRLFGTTTYYRAYRGQSLDQYDALERARRSGLRTPAAPPPR